MVAQVAGWLGAALVITAYILVSTKRVDGGSATYQCLNLVGAVGLGINVIHQKSWPSLAIQLVWASVAIVALAKGLHSGANKRRKR
jgi:hypothetical protein